MQTRRTIGMAFAAALVATTALVAGPAPAAANDEVTFRLNWLMYGFHTPFYLGVERGYYADEGIDLTIGEGQGSVRAVQTVGAKGDMFGLADGGSVTAGIARGAPVKAVMAVTNSSPYSLSVRADTGITTLKEVEGKTIASAPGEAGLQLLPALFAANDVDIDKVNILRVEGAGKMVAVMEGRAEGLMAGLDNQSLTLPREGVPLVDFAYSKNGTNTVGLTIFTHTDTLEENPDLVARFVRATARSFQAALEDPDASIAAGLDGQAGPGPRPLARAADGGLQPDAEPGQRRPAARPVRRAGLGRHAGVDEGIHGARDRHHAGRAVHQRVRARVAAWRHRRHPPASPGGWRSSPAPPRESAGRSPSGSPPKGHA